MLTESRTQPEIYAEFLATNPREKGIRWLDEKRSRWETLIDWYRSHEWQLIPIQWMDKKPKFNYRNWQYKSLEYEDALEWALSDEGGNLAVNLGASNLICVDWDNRELPDKLKEWLSKTRSAISPRGYHLYMIWDETVKEKQYDALRMKLAGKADMFRAKIESNPDNPHPAYQYCLLPLSHVKSIENIIMYDKDGKKVKTTIFKSPPAKYYEWLTEKEPIPFKEFMEDVLDE